jgi:hypothetical protein
MLHIQYATTSLRPGFLSFLVLNFVQVCKIICYMLRNLWTKHSPPTYCLRGGAKAKIESYSDHVSMLYSNHNTHISTSWCNPRVTLKEYNIVLPSLITRGIVCSLITPDNKVHTKFLKLQQKVYVHCTTKSAFIQPFATLLRFTVLML